MSPQRGQPNDMLDLRCPLGGDERVQTVKYKVFINVLESVSFEVCNIIQTSMYTFLQFATTNMLNTDLFTNQREVQRIQKEVQRNQKKEIYEIVYKSKGASLSFSSQV
uniref:Uncharacterized protein n=1 Tax=Glossina austeni TaxID=7395 RepID=A0A1A9V119_GLOAU